MHRIKTCDEKGFVLLNSLLELSILMIFLPIVVLFFGFMLSFSKEAEAKRVEWQLFSVELQSYLAGSDSVEIINNGGGIRAIQQSVEYDIELYEHSVRKQKFRQGHEIMLTRIKNCRFELDGQKLTVLAEFSNGVIGEADYVVTPP
ncbi:competence type IV pilus minor pilin ComGF [Planococcus sp. N064]|uniref:Competence type IV pilus minor pilin ComGF n=1 Tax=Planococcus liqunii TaxID=3058394 RepID=A0ABT8MPL6_9BACL|nr:competence type IV pilus minor pilin ComGF [Planococcus sp. N064]MDN7226830.1 competence type IV pilus minor pilin ComGF [Planococcus sp. N064]